jgi:hypothetical protein
VTTPTFVIHTRRARTGGLRYARRLHIEASGRGLRARQQRAAPVPPPEPVRHGRRRRRGVKRQKMYGGGGGCCWYASVRTKERSGGHWAAGYGFTCDARSERGARPMGSCDPASGELARSAEDAGGARPSLGVRARASVQLDQRTRGWLRSSTPRPSLEMEAILRSLAATGFPPLIGREESLASPPHVQTG